MSDKLQKQAEENKILEIRSGSHLYGTDTKESDEDYIGIFMPPEEYIYGLKSVQEVDLGIRDKNISGKNTSDAVDRKLYEFRKFINLAIGNNPNIIEILFVNTDNILYINDFGKKLLEARHLFPSKLAAKKFIGYAHSQKHKMIIRRDNFNELRYGYSFLSKLPDKMVLVEVISLPNNKMRAEPNNVASSMVPCFTKRHQHIHCGDISIEPGVYVKKARKILKERLDKVTNRSELVLKYGFDTKFASHLIRLLTEGISLLENGELEFPLPNTDLILKVKQGKMNINEIVKMADELEAQLDSTLKQSSLPSTPRYEQIEKLTIDLMKLHLQ